MFDSLTEALSLVERSYSSNTVENLEPVIEFISKQQVKNGKDAGVFIELGDVSSPESRLFTGERLQTRLAIKNMLTINSARAILISKVPSSDAQKTIELTNSWLENQCFSGFCSAGECRHSTLMYMRYLALQGNHGKLEFMIPELSRHRDGKGSWKGFPYYYTLLTLLEIPIESAKEELLYAYPTIEDKIRHSRSSEPFSSRREEILERVRSTLG
ncbi:MAG: hypothetical protein ACFFDQ_08370 [Candidatus Thorarchaeota archaeon]